VRLALDLEDCHPSVLLHCWLGHLTCKIVSEMTYNVSSGTLNPTIPYLQHGRLRDTDEDGNTVCVTSNAVWVQLVNVWCVLASWLLANEMSSLSVLGMRDETLMDDTQVKVSLLFLTWIHQKHEETVTVWAEQICDHRPCQHRKSHHRLGGGDNYRPRIWSDNTVDQRGCQNPTGSPRRHEQRRGGLPALPRLRRVS